MSSSEVLGQFLWHELLTPDPAAGGGFYSKVFGWNASPMPGVEDYMTLGHAQGPVAGARVVGKDSLASKAGPNWLTYVGVPDLAAALAETEAQGGAVIHPVTELPGDGGRYAVITDPQGATIGLFEPPSSRAGGAGPMSGPVEWHELTAEDPQAALDFYNTLFGWDVIATHEMGGEVGTYYLFGKGEKQLGGAFVRGKSLPATWPRWLVYMRVPGVTAAVAAVVEAGGTVLNGPHQVPGGNWIAQVIDSHGVPMAVHGPKEAAAAAAKAPAKPTPKAKSKTPPKDQPAAKAAEPALVVAKPKAKVKTKPEVKAKTKALPKPKTEAKGKTKVVVRAKTKAATPKVKVKAKSKSKSKAASKPKRSAQAMSKLSKGSGKGKDKKKDKKRDKKKGKGKSGKARRGK